MLISKNEVEERDEFLELIKKINQEGPIWISQDNGFTINIHPGIDITVSIFTRRQNKEVRIDARFGNDETFVYVALDEAWKSELNKFRICNSVRQALDIYFKEGSYY